MFAFPSKNGKRALKLIKISTRTEIERLMFFDKNKNYGGFYLII